MPPWSNENDSLTTDVSRQNELSLSAPADVADAGSDFGETEADQSVAFPETTGASPAPSVSSLGNGAVVSKRSSSRLIGTAKPDYRCDVDPLENLRVGKKSQIKNIARNPQGMHCILLQSHYLRRP